MSREKQIEEMAKATMKHCKIDNQCGSCHWTTCNECLSEVLYNAGYRKQSEVIDEFAKRLKNYPINVRLPCLGLETKEEIEAYVNNLFDQIESIVDKIAEEMKGGAE